MCTSPLARTCTCVRVLYVVLASSYSLRRHINRQNVNLTALGRIQVNIASLADCGENKFAKSSATLHSVNVFGVGYLTDTLAD